MNIKYKKLDIDAHEPTRGSALAAGYDIYAYTGGYEVVVRAGETVKIHTGIAVKIPDGYYGALYARSGIAVRNGLRPANAVGVIDADYTGEIIVALHNDSFCDQYISNNMRIAQLVIMKHEEVEFDEVDALDETDRGEGGFGSTGK